jgi:hypothetical protein
VDNKFDASPIKQKRDASNLVSSIPFFETELDVKIVREKRRSLIAQVGHKRLNEVELNIMEVSPAKKI